MEEKNSMIKYLCGEMAMFPILSYQNQYQFEFYLFNYYYLDGNNTNSSNSSKWNCFFFSHDECVVYCDG